MNISKLHFSLLILILIFQINKICAFNEEVEKCDNSNQRVVVHVENVDCNDMEESKIYVQGMYTCEDNEITAKLTMPILVRQWTYIKEYKGPTSSLKILFNSKKKEQPTIIGYSEVNSTEVIRNIYITCKKGENPQGDPQFKVIFNSYEHKPFTDNRRINNDDRRYVYCLPFLDNIPKSIEHIKKFL